MLLPQSSYDVAIVGAGPAGCAAALALRHSGLRVLLLDKAAFPRDKVCGDAIPGHTLKYLAQLDPAFAAALWQLQPRDDVRQSRLVAPNGRSLTLHWKLPSFSCARTVFDAALLDLVRTHSPTEIRENAALKNLRVDAEAVHLTLADGAELSCQLVLGCDGANSVVGRKLLPAPLDRAHHCASVRAYYEHVQGVEAGLTEFFFIKEYLQGYLWIFPVGAGRCNVGLGMLSETVARHKVDLKALLPQLLATHPALAARFAPAQQLGAIRGFGLPLGGGRTLPLSGARFMLCGDAASLIDPLQGHGIDTAVQSGMLAAAHVLTCFQKQDFSAVQMTVYDAAIAQKIAPKLSHSYRLMQFLGNKPWLVNAAVRLARLPGLRAAVQKVIG